MQKTMDKLLGKGVIDAYARLDNPQAYFRTVLLTVLLIVLDLVMLFFVFFHLFYTHDIKLVLASAVAVIVLTLIILYLRAYQNIQSAGHLASASLVLFFPWFAYLNQNDQFGLIWLFFVPFQIIAFTGWRIGIRYVSVYFALLLPLAYLNIGEWQNGEWTELSFIRLVLGILVGTALATAFDAANDALTKLVYRQRIKEASYVKKLQRLSTTDGLTAVYNRHHFNDVLNQKIKALKDSDMYLTFFMLDIDQFKLYNDYFGHQQGDKALKKIAKVVQNYIKRKDDLVFRLGGEEFGGILISDQPQETGQWIARLVEEVEHLQIQHAPEASRPYLTISIGIFSSKIAGNSTGKTLYKTADDALYQAKHNGRNQAVIATDSVLSFNLPDVMG